mmetsp:Transcript_7150/g.22083  ORF Transcript_7150/g.22083 Transcript_7150/m.22083 type:complete len:237 (-) Transcript_7150:1584-2294(-)
MMPPMFWKSVRLPAPSSVSARRSLHATRTGSVWITLLTPIGSTFEPTDTTCKRRSASLIIFGTGLKMVPNSAICSSGLLAMRSASSCASCRLASSSSAMISASASDVPCMDLRRACSFLVASMSFSASAFSLAIFSSSCVMRDEVPAVVSSSIERSSASADVFSSNARSFASSSACFIFASASIAVCIASFSRNCCSNRSAFACANATLSAAASASSRRTRSCSVCLSCSAALSFA